jgi:hypothetical protein
MNELAKIIVFTPEELESLLERAAERGAIRALAAIKTAMAMFLMIVSCVRKRQRSF